MFAGPKGARVAEKTEILAAFPKGQEFLRSFGHKSTTVLSLDEPGWTIIMCWCALSSYGDLRNHRRSRYVKVDSTFILYIDDGVHKIVFQHRAGRVPAGTASERCVVGGVVVCVERAAHIAAAHATEKGELSRRARHNTPTRAARLSRTRITRGYTEVKIEASDVPSAALIEYARIPIVFEVNAVLDVGDRLESGGFTHRESIQTPYLKDYDAIAETPAEWARRYIRRSGDHDRSNR